MALVDPAREAEWNRRRRADRDGIPMPPEFRIFDDPEAISVRFPVSLWPGAIPRSRFMPAYLLGNSCLLTLWVLIGYFHVRSWALLVGATLSLVAIPLALRSTFRRRIAVTPEGIDVGWWPVQLSSRRIVHRGITQVFVAPQGGGLYHASRSPAFGVVSVDLLPGSPDASAGTKYEIRIVRADGSRERLVGSLRSLEHALFLERWLERRLGIPDAPVAGEAG